MKQKKYMKNNKWVFKGLLCLFSFFIITNCQTKPIVTKPRDGKSGTQPQTGPFATPAPITEESISVPQEEEPSYEPSQTPVPVANGQTYRVGLILGPGTFKSYAHVGFLQELMKSKISIHAIAGLEWGAMVAALYAQKGQAYDVEWQFSKLNEEELLSQGILGATIKKSSVQDIKPFLKKAFEKTKLEDFKVPFACSFFDLNRFQSYMQTRGMAAQVLPSCMSLPPLWPPNGSQFADATNLQGAAEFLRKQGANVIIYVHLLSGQAIGKENKLEASNRIAWTWMQQSLVRQFRLVDYVVSVNTVNSSLLNTKSQRELLKQGQQAGQRAVKYLTNKYGL